MAIVKSTSKRQSTSVCTVVDENGFKEVIIDQEPDFAIEDADGNPLSHKDMIKGFAKSIKDIAASGVSTVDKEEHKRRYDICLDCDKLDNGRCKLCGCFMKIKSKFNAMRCPAGKWVKSGKLRDKLTKFSEV